MVVHRLVAAEVVVVVVGQILLRSCVDRRPQDHYHSGPSSCERGVFQRRVGTTSWSQRAVIAAVAADEEEEEGEDVVVVDAVVVGAVDN